MSLWGLARAAGVSPSLVSQIERGKANPSIAALYALVSVLRVSMDELFFDHPGGAAATAAGSIDAVGRPLSGAWEAPSEGPVLRAGNRLSLTLATGVRWERLIASPDSWVEFLCCVYPVGGESAPAKDLVTHRGSEYGIVLEGHLGATVGSETYALYAGDSIAFQSSAPHRIWNLSEDKPARAIWMVIGRDGDPRLR